MKAFEKIFATVLAWFDNPAFSFVFAEVLAMVAFIGADPVAGIPMLNVAVLAFLVGMMMVAVILTGTGIVLKKEYNWRAALCGALGSGVGVLIVWLVTKSIAQ